MKECPRCGDLYAVLLGNEVIKDGPQARPVTVAGRPKAKAEYKLPRKKVVEGKFPR